MEASWDEIPQREFSRPKCAWNQEGNVSTATGEEFRNFFTSPI
jgi:hypothetical protein